MSSPTALLLWLTLLESPTFNHRLASELVPIGKYHLKSSRFRYDTRSFAAFGPGLNHGQYQVRNVLSGFDLL